MLRTHTCGELTKKQLGRTVELCGWVQSRRDHGGVIFIDLRDRYGITQVVFDPSHDKKVHAAAERIGREWALHITGKVRERPKGMRNPKLPTGQIEVITDKLDILNKSALLPIEIEDRKPAGEELRLKYRYLDLRRPIMQKQLATRHTAVQAAREYLNSQNFLEIETPTLLRHTPEGARDFIVPSRLHAGKWYSLPQSPQLYKQTLMVSGFDRYYQIARCLRDEDLRADRQPEFTQIDLEMSFAEEKDVFDVIEGMIKNMFKKTLDVNVKIPFPRMTYHEAMTKYGSDAPDVRFGLELVDVSDIAKKSDFTVFKSVLSKGGVVYALNAQKCAKFSRKEIDGLTDLARTYHLPGLAWMKVGKGGTLESSVVKFFKPEVQKEIAKKLKAKEGDLLLFAADTFAKALTALGHLRVHIAQKIDIIPDTFALVWVHEFPLFEQSEEGGWKPMHHIFTMPKPEHLELLEKDPSKVEGILYDLVLNGVELGSGSIRIHKPDIQERVMKVIGMSHEEAREKFGFLLDAFKYGAPPHGGIALGLDRLIALMCGATDIREVIAFPKNKKMENPMDGSPSTLDPAHLKEMHLKSELPK